MSLPTLHLIAPFHAIPNQAHSHCAFSGKSLRFSKMMHLAGYKVVEYANAGSESEADEKVVMLTKEEFEQFYPAQKPSDFHGSYAVIGERGWPTFNQKLAIELMNRVKTGDIVGHQFGRAHSAMVQLLPNVPHVEIGIGYPDKPFGAFRIFESQAWKHYHWGRDDHDDTVKNDRGMNRLYTWVVPNYFDVDEWPFYSEQQNEDYILFMGRITPEKGMQTIVEIIRENALMAKEKLTRQLRFVFAGQGNFDELIARQIVRSPNPFIGGMKPMVDFVGPVYGKDRAALVGKARCMLMPTSFVEPFGGSGVEAMLSGTPLLAQTYGAFTETVYHGINGYNCNTLGDWLTAIEESRRIPRWDVCELARSRYGLAACAKMYDSAFRALADLSGQGWYSRTSHSIPSTLPQQVGDLLVH